MAVNFPGSASSQILVNSTGVPGSTLYSVVGWGYFNSGTTTNYLWSLDSATAGQYAVFGAILSNLSFDWAGTGSTNTIGGAVSTGTWYRYGVVVNGTAATLYQGTATTALSTYTQAANYVQPTGTLSWKIGGSTANASNGNNRTAAFRVYDHALTLAEINQEHWSYLPFKTSGLTRAHPFVNAETTDYSGLGRTLTGGTGITTVAGPPISWARRTPPIQIPWDPTTQVWYAIYQLSDGSLISVTTTLPDSFDTGTYGYKLYYGAQIDQTRYEWDTALLAFVLRSSTSIVDRVADLLGEAGMSAVWADLSGANSTTLQNRIAQLLGPYRYRNSAEPVDLIAYAGMPVL